MSLSMFGCVFDKSKKKSAEKQMTDAEIEGLFELDKHSENEYYIKGYKGTVPDVKIPSTYKGKKIVAFTPETFQKTSIKSIDIPSTIDRIQAKSFLECTDLKTVKLNEGLKMILTSAFQSSGVENITIPGTVEEIDYYAFKDCASLKTVTMEKGIKKLDIKDGAFMGCKIDNMTLPGRMTEVVENVLYLTTSIKNIVLSDGVKKINENAFSGLKLETITIPGNVTTIGSSAFKKSTLKTVILNEGLKEISDYVFSQTLIESIVIPKSVEKVGANVFENCEQLKNINCKANSKSSGWDAGWNMFTTATVAWGYLG